MCVEPEWSAGSEECVVHGSQPRSPGAEPPGQGSLPGTLKQVSGEYVLSSVEFTSGTGAQGLTCAQPKFSLSYTPIHSNVFHVNSKI